MVFWMEWINDSVTGFVKQIQDFIDYVINDFIYDLGLKLSFLGKIPDSVLLAIMIFLSLTAIYGIYYIWKTQDDWGKVYIT